LRTAGRAADYHNTSYQPCNVRTVIDVQIIEELATVEGAAGLTRPGRVAYAIVASK
jgi:hypothetical protein